MAPDIEVQAAALRAVVVYRLLPESSTTSTRPPRSPVSRGGRSSILPLRTRVPVVRVAYGAMMFGPNRSSPCGVERVRIASGLESGRVTAMCEVLRGPELLRSEWRATERLTFLPASRTRDDGGLMKKLRIPGITSIERPSCGREFGDYDEPVPWMGILHLTARCHVPSRASLRSGLRAWARRASSVESTTIARTGAHAAAQRRRPKAYGARGGDGHRPRADAPHREPSHGPARKHRAVTARSPEPVREAAAVAMGGAVRAPRSSRVRFEFARFHAQAMAGGRRYPRGPRASRRCCRSAPALMALRRFVATGSGRPPDRRGDPRRRDRERVLRAQGVLLVGVRSAPSRARLEMVGGRLDAPPQAEQKKSASRWWVSAPAMSCSGSSSSDVPSLDVRTVSEFLGSDYNHVADARLLAFFAAPRHGDRRDRRVLRGSLFVRHLWCRFVCHYGAFLGLVSWFSPQRIVREGTCIVQALHAGLPERDPRARNCACSRPVYGLHGLRDRVSPGRGLASRSVRPRKQGWSPLLVPVVAIAVLLGVIAPRERHWYSRRRPPEFAERYRNEAMQASFERTGGRPR